MHCEHYNILNYDIQFCVYVKSMKLQPSDIQTNLRQILCHIFATQQSSEKS